VEGEEGGEDWKPEEIAQYFGQAGREKRGRRSSTVCSKTRPLNVSAIAAIGGGREATSNLLLRLLQGRRRRMLRSSRHSSINSRGGEKGGKSGDGLSTDPRLLLSLWVGEKKPGPRHVFKIVLSFKFSLQLCTGRRKREGESTTNKTYE